jgi:hypothetical protein
MRALSYVGAWVILPAKALGVCLRSLRAEATAPTTSFPCYDPLAVNAADTSHHRPKSLRT